MSLEKSCFFYRLGLFLKIIGCAFILLWGLWVSLQQFFTQKNSKNIEMPR